MAEGADWRSRNPALVIGTTRSQADEAARNANRIVDASMISGLLGARVQLDHLLPLRTAIVAGLAPVIERQMAAAPPSQTAGAKRLVALPATAPAKPVVVRHLGFGRRHDAVQAHLAARDGVRR